MCQTNSKVNSGVVEADQRCANRNQYGYNDKFLRYETVFFILCPLSLIVKRFNRL